MNYNISVQSYSEQRIQLSICGFSEVDKNIINMLELKKRITLKL